MNSLYVYKVFPHIIFKYKSPLKVKIPIKTINNVFEKKYFDKKNVDINDIDYSENFWKNIKK